MPDRPDPEVHSITDAGVPLSHDVAGRTKRYLWSMGIRTACVLGAVIAPSPWRWVLAGGAIGLPYIAVVVANAGRERGHGEGTTVIPLTPTKRAIGGHR
jgi:hypothetical protein